MSSNIIELSKKELILSTFSSSQVLSSKSISTGTWTSLGKVAFEPGIWFINVNLSFAGGTTGRRGVGLYLDSTNPNGPGTSTRPAVYNGIQVQACPSSSWRTYVEYDTFMNIATSDTVNVWVYQNQGDSLTCYGCWMRRFRLA